jgi:hypothetical protein
MMRFRYIAFFAMLLIGARLTAQVGIQPIRDTSKTSPSQLHHVGKFALVGAGIGGAAGVVGGAIGSTYIGCGCSDRQKTVGLALFFGLEGAVAGALVGAISGVVFRAHAP